MNLEKFLDSLSTDFLYYLEELDTSSQVNPYAIVVDYFDEDTSYTVRFPSSKEELSRPQQYQMLSRFIRDTNKTAVGLVSFVNLDVPARPEIDERLWNRNATAALLGCVTQPNIQAFTISYESKIIIFDTIDGELIYSDIKDHNVWQDFIDNVAIFRDFLYCSCSRYSGTTILRWPTFYSMLETFGFKFEFNSEDVKTTFMLAQEPLTPVLTFSS